MRKLILLLALIFVFASTASAQLENGMSADVVLGQPDFNQSAAGTTQRRLNRPQGIFTDGKKLFISCLDSHRVLVWNSIPQTSFAPADLVIGQANFTAGGAATTQTGMNRPVGVFYDGMRLFVTEFQNHRLLIWNQLPTTNGAPADIVLGQANFVSGNANQGGAAAANTLNRPRGVFTNRNFLIVADSSNNRVLMWSSIPTRNDTPADIVLGQPDFTTTTGDTSRHKTSGPQFVTSDGVRLFVSDSGNERILIWNKIPTKSFTPADIVLGQPDFISSQRSARNLGEPSEIVVDNNALYLSDRMNHRVLIWKPIPTQNNQKPNFVIGQTDFVTNVFGVSDKKIREPVSLATDGRRLFVGEDSNNRVLIFNLIESTTIDLGPQFTQGKAVVGKVFWDFNANGRQDSGGDM